MTQTNNQREYFGRQGAQVYDQQRQKLAPMKDTLHYFMSEILSALPADGRLLCVGAGTGAEMIALAQMLPDWTFVAVEPAAAMAQTCQQKVTDAGLADRCTIHVGYLESLPPSDHFDAATSILVSHFLTDLKERQAYFAEIAARLRPGGILITADLSGDMASPAFTSLADVWYRIMESAGLPANRDALGKQVAVIPSDDIKALLSRAGFDQPVLFFQALLIHGWFASRSP